MGIRNLVFFTLLSGSAYAAEVEIKIQGKCLDVPSNQVFDGQRLQLYTCNGTKAQRFTVEEVKPSTPPPTTTPPPIVNPPPPTTTPTPTDKDIAVYFASWSSPWASSGANHELARMPSYVGTILLAFSRPEAAYTPGAAFWTAGLDFSSDPAVIRDAIAIAKSQGKKVYLSVGGATYENFKAYNVDGVVALANYLGVQGIDIDYESSSQTCGWITGTPSCPSDANYIDVIKKTRAKWPRPKLLTTASWSTGAMGEGDHAASKMDSRFIGGNFGMMINVAKQAGGDLDSLMGMFYDAGSPATTGYNWKTALTAYQKYYKGPIYVGAESPPESWGGNVSDEADVRARAKATGKIMIWSWHKPGGKQFAQWACRELGMSGCDTVAAAAPAAVEESKPRDLRKNVERSVFHKKLDRK